MTICMLYTSHVYVFICFRAQLDDRARPDHRAGSNDRVGPDDSVGLTVCLLYV